MAVLPGEALFGRIILRGRGGKKIRGDIQDHTLIGNARQKLRFVHDMVAYQNNISGSEQIAPALYNITSVPGEKENQFIKIMIVIVDVGAPVVFQMKQTKVLSEEK